MSLHEGPTGPVSSVPFGSSPPSRLNTMCITSSQPEDSPLPVATPPKAVSALASRVSSATSSAVLPRAASSSDSVKLSFSGAAQMAPANADTTSPSRGSLQYLRDLLA